MVFATIYLFLHIIQMQKGFFHFKLDVKLDPHLPLKDTALLTVINTSYLILHKILLGWIILHAGPKSTVLPCSLKCYVALVIIWVDLPVFTPAWWVDLRTENRIKYMFNSVASSVRKFIRMVQREPRMTRDGSTLD